MNVRRAGSVAAPAEDVWAVVADPYTLPRWWPRTQRVEDVRADGWTTVLSSERGRAIRADWTLVESVAPSRRVWEQELEGTAFERLFSSNRVSATLAQAGPGETEVVLAVEQRLRGWARLAPFLVRKAMREQLSGALNGLREVVER